ncbi:MAG: hypothetical protein V4576_01910 [Patescibacteria group bacterium]
MKTTQKGFIALFFTLGIASILLVGMSISSQNIFDFVRAREGFKEARARIEQPIQCADGFIDILARTMHWFSEYEYQYVFEGISCRVSDIDIVRESRDIVAFSFKSGQLFIKGSIVNGFIADIKTL